MGIKPILLAGANLQTQIKVASVHSCHLSLGPRSDCPQMQIKWGRGKMSNIWLEVNINR